MNRLLKYVLFLTYLLFCYSISVEAQNVKAKVVNEFQNDIKRYTVRDLRAKSYEVNLYVNNNFYETVYINLVENTEFTIWTDDEKYGNSILHAVDRNGAPPENYLIGAGDFFDGKFCLNKFHSFSQYLKRIGIFSTDFFESYENLNTSSIFTNSNVEIIAENWLRLAINGEKVYNPDYFSRPN
ncbi:MAG: hypothetical protein AB7S50_15240 [Bacteroidales bacterium]